MAEDFTWYSLEEFVKAVSEVEELEKADVPVKSHERTVHDQRVPVVGYRQQRAEAAVKPIVGIPGPIKHFAKPGGPQGSGASKDDDASKLVVPKPEKTVPTVAGLPEHPTCPNCAETSSKPLQHGDSMRDTAPPRKDPLKGKSADKITLQDIVDAGHRHRFLNEQQYRQLPPEQQKQHRENHFFSHLNPEGKAALQRDAKKILRPFLRKAVDIMGLRNLKVDEEELLPQYVNRIIDELTPFERAEYSFRYAKKGTKMWEKAKKHAEENGFNLKGLYHAGVDPNEIKTDKDLVHKLINKGRIHWAIRFLNREVDSGRSALGYSPFLNSDAIQRETKLKKHVSDSEKAMGKIAKKYGVSTTGGGTIEKDKNYSLADLEDVAAKSGYMLVKHSDPSGNLERISIIPEDDEHATPVDEASVASGAKLTDTLRDKLGKLVNPDKPTQVHDAPFTKYFEVRHELGKHEEALPQIEKDLEQKREAHEVASRGAEKHFGVNDKGFAGSIGQYASEATDKAQQLFEKIESPHKDKAKHIAQYINDALMALPQSKELAEDDGSDFKNALKHVENATRSVGHIPPGNNKSLLYGLQTDLKKLQTDIKQYQAKLNTDEDDDQTGEVADAYKEVKDRYESHKNKIASLREQLEHYKNDPDVQTFDSLAEEKKQKEQELLHNREYFKQGWDSSLEKMSNEGEETGNVADDAAFEQFNRKKDPSAKNYNESVPEDFNLEDKEETEDAAHKLLEAFNATKQGDFIFGGTGNNKGLVHVAHHALNQLAATKQFHGVLDKILESSPYDDSGLPDHVNPKDEEAVKKHWQSKTPHIFRGYPALSDERQRWRRLHFMDKDIVAHYALAFSDYNPFPMSKEDFYAEGAKDNSDKDLLSDPKKEDEDLHPLLHEIRRLNRDNYSETGQHPDGSKKYQYKPQKDRKGVTKKTFEYQYYKMLNYLGNHAVEEMMKESPYLRETFSTIRELNKPHRETGKKSTPGRLRRDLQRRMDVLYGTSKNELPPWKHTHPGTIDSWLNSFRSKKDRKQFTSQNWWEDSPDDPVKYDDSGEWQFKSQRLVVSADPLRKAVRLVVSK